MDANSSRHDGNTDTFASLEQRAIEARQAGDFDHAGHLFALAAGQTDALQTQLNLQIRQACCLLATERYDEAAALATVVAQQARALAQAELARQRLSLSRKAIDLAMRNIGVEQARFDLGKATSFDVLERQDELRSAQLREARAQIDGQLALLSVRALTGDLLDDYGIAMPVGDALEVPASPTPAVP